MTGVRHMHSINRRDVLKGLGAASLVASSQSLAAPAIAAAKGKLVIIGGGPGGASVAGFVRRTAPDIDVVLVEPQAAYTTCFYSNHYLAGLRTIDSLTHTYEGLRRLGVRVAQDRADTIDQTARTVRLTDGRVLPYDVLVVAPGIDLKFGGIEGYDEAAARIMPHAWHGREQLEILHGKIRTMRDGGVVVLAPPRNPYRCPPGPYERASAIAHYLKTNKPRSKLIILDPKMSFSKQPVFEEAFQTIYKDIVELHLTNDIDDMSLVKVDVKDGIVVTKSGERIKADVANVIPDQRAGDIAHRAGLTEGDWCPVEPESFRAKKAERIYVLGDAAIAADMPKSAFAANNQALVVAGNVIADLTGKERPPARFRNTCWSLIAPGNSAKIGADYAPGEKDGKRVLVPQGAFVSKPHETAALRKEVFEESLAWYSTFVDQVFAKAR